MPRQTVHIAPHSLSDFIDLKESQVIRTIDPANFKVRPHKSNIQDDLKLLQRVIWHDKVAIKTFTTRMSPFLDNFSSDQLWESYEIGYQTAITHLFSNDCRALAKWQPNKCSLNQHIERELNTLFRKKIGEQRSQARSNPILANVVFENQNNLSDVHYWILCKVLVEKVPLKKLPKYFGSCPEVKLNSEASIGTTLRRALEKLSRVCSASHKPAIEFYLRTRKRSGPH